MEHRGLLRCTAGLLLAVAGACSSPASTNGDDAAGPPDQVAAVTDQSMAPPPDLAGPPPRDQSVPPPDLAGCASDRDCKDPGAARCDLPSHRCVPCLTTDHCDAASICVGNQCLAGCDGTHGCGGNLACCASRCSDVAADTANCGGCGLACGNGKACCGGACVDTNADPGHCGACGMACLPPPNSMAGCQGGRCVAGACNPGWADCNGNAGDGCEAGVGSDVANCGRCGRSCAAPHAVPGCIGGACLVASCDSGYRNCNGDPADGCEVDVANDVKNCGACGSNCLALPHASAGCAMGGCVVSQCDAGYGNCDKKDANGCESQLASDPANCGGCGKACPAPPNVATTCTAGVCAHGGCNVGYADCNNDMADGCEAKLGTDPKNCGKCGVACAAPANASAGCAGGVCGVGQCNAGFGDCDKNGGNGCEASLSIDSNNCGACGKACLNGQKCSNGQCQVLQACAEANESAVATLTCPNGTTVVSIDFASYGTPTGMCGAYQTSGCHAGTSVMVVQGLCLGQNACNVSADNNTFGDPCYGTYKRLYIQASCQ